MCGFMYHPSVSFASSARLAKLTHYLVRFIHVKDPYAQQDEPALIGDAQEAELESVPVLGFPGAILDSSVEECASTPTDEPQVYSEHPQTPDIDEPASTSNLTALHLLRHFKQGPGQW